MFKGLSRVCGSLICSVEGIIAVQRKSGVPFFPDTLGVLGLWCATVGPWVAWELLSVQFCNVLLWKKENFVCFRKQIHTFNRLKFHRFTFCIFITLLAAGDQIQAFQILLPMTQTLKAPKTYEFESLKNLKVILNIIICCFKSHHISLYQYL